MSAYLVETRSIGGLSGSPVFAYLGLVRVTNEGNLQVVKGKHGRFLLLGVMSGHYKGEMGVSDAVNADADTDAEEREVNMGIGIVVPVQRLMEVVKRPELDDIKAKKRQELLDEEAGNTVADSAGSVASEGPVLATREDFESALRKVSRRKPSPPDA